MRQISGTNGVFAVRAWSWWLIDIQTFTAASFFCCSSSAGEMHVGCGCGPELVHVFPLEPSWSVLEDCPAVWLLPIRLNAVLQTPVSFLCFCYVNNAQNYLWHHCSLQMSVYSYESLWLDQHFPRASSTFISASPHNCYLYTPVFSRLLISVHVIQYLKLAMLRLQVISPRLSKYFISCCFLWQAALHDAQGFYFFAFLTFTKTRVGPAEIMNLFESSTEQVTFSNIGVL